MTLKAITCKKCLVSFSSLEELNQHNLALHMRGFMINTDSGSTIMFSRIAHGKFVCPSCFAVCKSFDEMSLHLFCELEGKMDSQTEIINNTESGKYLNINESTGSYNTHNEKDSDNHYNFILTPKLIDRNSCSNLLIKTSMDECSANVIMQDQSYWDNDTNLWHPETNTIFPDPINSDDPSKIIEYLERKEGTEKYDIKSPKAIKEIIGLQFNQHDTEILFRKLLLLPTEFTPGFKISKFTTKLPSRLRGLAAYKNCRATLLKVGLLETTDFRMLKRNFELDSI